MDEYAASVWSLIPLDTIAEKLTQPFSSDSEKVRAIYYWVTHNISYDVVRFHRPERMAIFLNSTDSAELEDYVTSRYGTMTYDRGTGVCEGYASLFKLLCRKAKINCVVVRGYGRTSMTDIGKPYNTNHAWNAVKVDGKWRLVDACWGSGYCDDAVTTFHQKFTDYYFLTAPDVFAYNHYPDNTEWLLTNSPASVQEFTLLPYFFFSESQTAAVKFSPRLANIERQTGEYIYFEIEVNSANKSKIFQGVQLNEFDSAGKKITPPRNGASVKSVKRSDNKITIEYKVWSEKVKTIQVWFNDLHSTLGYKLTAYKDYMEHNGVWRK